MRETILEFIQNKNMDGLKAALATVEELEILQAFIELSPEEQVIAFRLLTKDKALVLFEELDTEFQHNLLTSFTDEKTIEFVSELAPDDRVRLFEELPAGVAKQLTAKLSKQERKLTNLLMGYEAETAGRIMTPKFISLDRNMTAEQALGKVRRQAAEMETVYALYVTDSKKKLKGVLTLKELVCAEPDVKIDSLMAKKAISVSTDTTKIDVAYTLQELDLIAVPVVDKEERIVGIVTIDDAVDIIEEEAEDYIFDAAGLVDVTSIEADRSELLVKGKTWHIWRVRLPFLIITLGAGILAGGIIDWFEDALSLAAVAMFIPLIMDMGGNVGTQSSTVFARGVVLGHIETTKFFKHLLKEVWVGFSMGVLVGAIAGTITAIWQGIPLLGVAVGMSLVTTMSLAALLGFLVPFVLIKLNVDQAAGSAPIITSIKDVAGLVIYFTSVQLLLSHLL